MIGPWAKASPETDGESPGAAGGSTAGTTPSTKSITKTGVPMASSVRSGATIRACGSAAARPLHTFVVLVRPCSASTVRSMGRRYGRTGQAVMPQASGASAAPK